jgi:segregation and condensation protein A
LTGDFDQPTVIEETAIPEAKQYRVNAEKLFGDPGSGGSKESDSEYSVRLEIFQGPMDLLLYLIEKDELDIYNIPIMDITRQFLEYVEIMKSLDIDSAGEFMVMAARLMQIKARMLLPVIAEEEEEIDPRAELVQALVEYKRIKKAAEIMSDMESITRVKHNAIVGYNGRHDSAFVELEVNLFDLLRVFREVSARKPDDASTYDVEPIRISVEERIEFLSNRIPTEGLRFIDIFTPQDGKILMIITFIALLELVRLRKLSVRQNTIFSEIWIYRI